MVKKNTILNFSYTILIISTTLTLFYYFYILKYIKKLKDIEICDKLNYPYLNIFYGIIIITIVFVIFMFPPIRRIFGIKELVIFKYIIKYNSLIIGVSLSINIFIVKLLHDISNQNKCKDIYPNFRMFLFIFNLLGIVINSINLYSSITLKSLSNKELKDIKKYLKTQSKK
tara:strand:- start:601 stop:1113 length:513 start_codon:yes stop_codon:yes gene_type:complete